MAMIQGTFTSRHRRARALTWMAVTRTCSSTSAREEQAAASLSKQAVKLGTNAVLPIFDGNGTA